MYFEDGTFLVRLVVDPVTGESLPVDTLRTDAEVVDLRIVLGEV